MSVKYYNKDEQKWVVFPGTIGIPGKDAYTIAQENGYAGTREEYNDAIYRLTETTAKVDEVIIDLSNTKSVLEDTRIDLSNTKTKLDEVASDLENTKINLNNTKNDLETEVTRAKNSESILQGNIDILNVRVGNIEQNIDEIEENVSHIDVRLHTAEQDINNTKNDLNNLSSNYNVTKEKVSSLETDLNDTKINLNNVTLDLDRAKSNITNLENSLSITNNNVSRIDLNVNNALDDISALKREGEQLKQQLNSVDNNLNDLVVDNCSTSDPNKALSANQGVKLMAAINSINSFEVIVLRDGVLPNPGLLRTLYLLPRTGAHDKQGYDEYIYIANEGWELIGSLDNIDLENYYTKDEVYNKTESYTKSQVDSIIKALPDVISTNSGQGNVVTSVVVNNTNKHQIDVTKGLSVYTTSEVDTKISEVNNKIVSIPSISINYDGTGNVVTAISASGTNNHNITATKGIDAALKSDLANYYTKNEVDGKIPSTVNAVTSDSTLTSNYLVLGNGSKSVKISEIDVSNLLTKTNASSSISLKTVNGNSLFGSGDITIPTGNVSAGAALTADYLVVGNSNYNVKTTTVALSSLVTTTSIETILSGKNYATASSIPTSLPNPTALTINQYGNTIEQKTYNGSSAVTINALVPLSSTTTAGAPGVYFNSSVSTLDVSTVRVTENNRDAIIVVNANCKVTFGSGYYKDTNMDEVEGGTYKCYCITYISGNTALVNCAAYA